MKFSTLEIIGLAFLSGLKISEIAEELIEEEKEEKEHKKMIEMKKLKIMISQPMKGKTEEQIRSERAELVKKLEEKGHEVVDTIFAEETPEGDARLYYLAKSIEAMSKVDAVVFMPGWEKARGCQIEHEIAVKYNKFIKEVEDK